jgi:rubrerythrin
LPHPATTISRDAPLPGGIFYHFAGKNAFPRKIFPLQRLLFPLTIIITNNKEVFMSKTQENLMSAFAGESQANRKYLAYAKQADKEGLPQVAKLFRAAAEAETIHAHAHLRNAGKVGSTLDNLKDAINGETYEYTKMYPDMIKDAASEDQKAVKTYMEYVNAVEKVHAQLYQKALDAQGKVSAVDYYLCGVCGYTHEGPHTDKCPVCGAAASAFYKVS